MLFNSNAACQEWGFLRRGAQCGARGGAFALKRREDSRGRVLHLWLRPRTDAARCDPAKRCECYGATGPLSGGRDLMRRVARCDYVALLDVLATQLAEYPN